MSDEDPMQKMQASIERIERGLFGDEQMGQFGLVSRVNNHASRIKRLERWSISLAAAGSTIGLLYKFAVDWWPHK